MSRKLWQRSIVLAVASVAVAAGTACAAQAPQSPTQGAGLSVDAAALGSRSADGCGKGGEGGKGGKPGQPGEPGEPGRPGCADPEDLKDLKDLEDLEGMEDLKELDDLKDLKDLKDFEAFGELPDKPKDELSVVDKVRIVVALLTDEATTDEVAEKYDVSKKEVGTWREQVLDGDWAALMK
ncbi:hypothetical protein [Streptomyces wuyuanensis]|uniref:hypothetical protein n=1 Tax=Streptomyces wuyuanensis TaxID=1196353 RepID=UPI00381030C7